MSRGEKAVGGLSALGGQCQSPYIKGGVIKGDSALGHSVSRSEKHVDVGKSIDRRRTREAHPLAQRLALPQVTVHSHWAAKLMVPSILLQAERHSSLSSARPGRYPQMEYS